MPSESDQSGEQRDQREDHDQRFKTAIKRFFRMFVELVLPEWVDDFDFDSVEWQDKEIFPDPPRGRRRVMDLVAKIKLRHRHSPPTADAGDAAHDAIAAEETVWIFILVEIESGESLTDLRNQIFKYYLHLIGAHDLDVLPIALLLNVGLDGCGWQTVERKYRGRRICSLDFAYFGLPALDAVRFVTETNPLGAALSALMKIDADRKAWLKATALQTIGASGENEYDRFLLGEIVDTYLKLTPVQDAEFQSLVEKPAFKEARTMTTSWHQKGLVEGKIEGKAESLLLIGRAKFGKKPAKAVREKIMATKDVALLEKWLENVVSANSWDDVFA